MAYAEIARVLHGARRRKGLVVLGTALGYGLAAALASLLAGAVVLALGGGALARPAALAAAALSILAGLLLGAVALVRGALSPEAAARAVGRGEPALGEDLLSSVELERDRPELARTGRYSLALLDAHVERTAERARGLDLSRALPSRPARRAGLALAGVGLVHLAAFAALGAPLLRGYGRLARGEPPGPPRRADPITGDVEVTYRYPAYTARPEKTLSGTGGEITAPKGTEVRLRTRSDRPVKEARLAIAAAAGEKVLALQVAGGRELSGGFVVEEGGSYRFRFLERGRTVAEGPPIPIAVEPDAFPEVRILAPAAEVEVDARARLRVEWSASDDYGLADLTLVAKPPAGEERRTRLKGLDGARRTSGAFDLDLAPFRLAEGERLLYWLEVLDDDAVSGPKRSASATHAAKVYSEAEHHRAALERAQALWEETVRLLGDRLEQLPRGARAAPPKLAVGEALDGRTARLHEDLRQAAAGIRRDRGAPPALAVALANAAGGIRAAALPLASARQNLSRLERMGRGGEPGLSRQLEGLDDGLDRELEKDVLYLEELFDKQRAEDLVRLAKDLSARRRDLASLLERYRASPTEEGKKELLAEISRLRSRMQELMRRMGELAKGIADEHLNAEALAELSRSKDLVGGLDRLEQKLARGDLEGALRELDAMGSSMQDMLASLERAAGIPDRKNAALMKEMLEFKRQLEQVEAAQRQLASETGRVRSEYRRRVAERLERSADAARRLQGLARKALGEVKEAQRGASPRSEDDGMNARERLSDLERALGMRDFDAALESVRRALPPMQRLAMALEGDAIVSERYRAMTRQDPAEVREAARHAQAAVGPARQVREELERIFPDPRSILPRGEQAKLERLSRRQAELEGQAGAMQRRLQSLLQQAPVFPPGAGQAVGDSRGHMAQAAEELARRDPQRGHGQQSLAIDDLDRLRRGLEEMGKKAGSGGGGFPFPFAEAGSSLGPGDEEGTMGDASREKVEIPGADAYKAPEEFRKDLLEAMRQGTPEPYKSEVQRYYEELVK